MRSPLLPNLLLGFTFLALLLAGVAFAQSGRATMHGYVDFEDVAYNDLPQLKLHAKIELRPIGPNSGSGSATAETNEHGSYTIERAPLGEQRLRITAPGYKPYETEIYIPSDFTCSLGTRLHKAKPDKPTKR